MSSRFPNDGVVPSDAQPTPTGTGFGASLAFSAERRPIRDVRLALLSKSSAKQTASAMPQLFQDLNISTRGRRLINHAANQITLIKLHLLFQRS